MRDDTALTTSERTGDVVPRVSTLDGFVEAVSHTKGVGLADVDAFSTLVVRTRNSVYRVTVLRPHAREVMVQGGMFFTARTRACLNGSSFGGSCLKLGWVGVGLHVFHRENTSLSQRIEFRRQLPEARVGVGLHMEFHAEDQWVITSHVREIAVEASVEGPRC